MIEEENQCLTSTSTRTSVFKRLSISTTKKDQPLTSSFDRSKLIDDQHERKIKTLKAKSFCESNNDEKIHHLILSRTKRKLSADINTEGFVAVKPKLIVLTVPTNEEKDQSHDENKRF